MTDPAGPRIVVALDFPALGEALAVVDRLDPSRCRVKIGKELFTRAGPDVVRTLAARGFDVFLDLKYHDIPNTAAGACRAAAELGVWMLNVHASGGRRMMEAAREAVDSVPGRRPLLIAVTVLTSLEAADLSEVGVERSPGDQVERLAALSVRCGLDGVVCSPADLDQLAGAVPADFLRITPGVRPAAPGAGDDQRRVATPATAIAAGAHYLVIGRPITAAPDPLAALVDIEAGIAAT